MICIESSGDDDDDDDDLDSEDDNYVVDGFVVGDDEVDEVPEEPVADSSDDSDDGLFDRVDVKVRAFLDFITRKSLNSRFICDGQKKKKGLGRLKKNEDNILDDDELDLIADNNRTDVRTPQLCM